MLNYIVHDLAELVQTVEKIQEIRTNSLLWWRGHSKTEYKLRPSVFRADYGYQFEQNAIASFIQRAPLRHSNLPQSSDQAAWLFLMQHYGLPTRMMDWSSSPLIAAFFATESHIDETGAIWGLVPGYLSFLECGKQALIGVGGSPARQIIRAPFSREGQGEESMKIVSIIANHVDPRMLAQQSQFTVHGREDALEEVERSEEFLIRIDIARGARRRIANQLEMIGIHRSNLFPDLENLAKEISRKRWAAPELI